MSWLARSIVNTLHLNDQIETRGGVLTEDQLREEMVSTRDPQSTESDEDEDYGHQRGEDGDLDAENDFNQGRGVKDDLSELKDTLTRQFWGVASFLAPPPPPPPPPPQLFRKNSGVLQSQSKCDLTVSDSDDDGEKLKGEAELLEYDERDSGQFGEFSNLSPLEDHNSNTLEEAIGITDEVLAFAMNIAHHPETWLDFPLSEEEEFDDFDISDAQYKHALAVEQLAPRLAALRIELCPAHMSEGYFWTVYFVLLHSRLNKRNADLLSSPQIVQARAMWMQELQKKSKDDSYLFGSSSFCLNETADSVHESPSCESTQSRYTLDRMSPYDPSTPHRIVDNETENHLFNEIECIDKSVIKEDQAPKPVEKEIIVGSSIELPVLDEDDEDDDWLKDDADLIGYSSSMIVGNEEDVSFSDLEDDIDCSIPVKSKVVSEEWSATTNTF